MYGKNFENFIQVFSPFGKTEYTSVLVCCINASKDIIVVILFRHNLRDYYCCMAAKKKITAILLRSISKKIALSVDIFPPRITLK